MLTGEDAACSWLRLNLVAMSSAITALPWSRALKLVPGGSVVGLSALGGRWSWTLELLRQAENSRLELDVVFYSQQMERCTWQRTSTLLLQMEKASVRPNAFTYSSLVSAWAGAEQWEWACATVLAHDLTIGPALGNVAIGALSSASQWLLSGSFLSENRLRSLQPDAITLSSVGDSFAEAAEWASCLWWLMKIRRVPMTDSICTTGCSAINALEKCSLWRPLGAFLKLTVHLKPAALPQTLHTRSSLHILQKLDMWTADLDDMVFNSAVVACEKGEHMP